MKTTAAQTNPVYKKIIEYLTLEQQEKMIDAIPERDRLIFEFGMEYGLRKLGNQSPEMTMRYARHSQPVLTEAM